jgi:tRNA-2-methylthio-N6-dimethylallyladenosine synthase
MQARYRRLTELQNRIVFEKNLDQVGRVEEVLIEGPSKKDPAMATARTEGNRVVHVEGEFPPGRFLHVEITSAHKHHLVGVVR